MYELFKFPWKYYLWPRWCTKLWSPNVFMKELQNNLPQGCNCAWSYGLGCNGALIKCTLGLGKPKGGWNFGREGTGARWGTRGVSLQATWDWGGRFLSQLGGFQVSRRELARGNQSKGNARVQLCIVFRVRVYIGTIELMKDTSCMYNNNNRNECCW